MELLNKPDPAKWDIKKPDNYPEGDRDDANTCSKFLNRIADDVKFDFDESAFHKEVGTKEDFFDHVCNSQDKTIQVITSVGVIIKALLDRAKLIPGLIHSNNMLWRRGELLRRLLEHYGNLATKLEDEMRLLLNQLAYMAYQVHTLMNALNLRYDPTTGELTDNKEKKVDKDRQDLLGIDDRMKDLLDILGSIASGELYGQKLMLDSYPRFSLTFNRTEFPSDEAEQEAIRKELSQLLSETMAKLGEAKGVPAISADDIAKFTRLKKGSLITLVQLEEDYVEKAPGITPEQRKILQMAMFQIAFTTPASMEGKFPRLKALYDAESPKLPDFEIPGSIPAEDGPAEWKEALKLDFGLDMSKFSASEAAPPKKGGGDDGGAAAVVTDEKARSELPATNLGTGGLEIGGAAPVEDKTGAVYQALINKNPPVESVLPPDKFAKSGVFAGTMAVRQAKRGSARRRSAKRGSARRRGSAKRGAAYNSNFYLDFKALGFLLVQLFKEKGIDIELKPFTAEDVMNTIDASDQDKFIVSVTEDVKEKVPFITELAKAGVPDAEAAEGPKSVGAAKLDLSNVSLGETEKRDEVYERALKLAQMDCVKEYVRIRPVNNGDLRATEIQLTQRGLQALEELSIKYKGKDKIPKDIFANIPKFERSKDLDAKVRQMALQNQVWTKFSTEVKTVGDVKGTCLNFNKVFRPDSTDPKGAMFKFFIRDEPVDAKFVVNVNGGVLDDFNNFVKGGHPLVHTDFLKYGNRLRPDSFKFSDEGKVIMDENAAKTKVKASFDNGTLKPTYEDWKQIIAAEGKTSVDDFMKDFIEMMKFSAEVDRGFVDTIWPNLDVYFPVARAGKPAVPAKNVIVLFYGASGSGKTHSAGAIIDKIFDTMRASDDKFSLRLCSDYQDKLYDYYGTTANNTFKKFSGMKLEDITYQTPEVIKLNNLAAKYRAGDATAGGNEEYNFFEGRVQTEWKGTLANDTSNPLTSNEIPKDPAAFKSFEAEMKKRVAVFRSVTDTGLNPESSRSHLFYIFERAGATSTDGKYLIVADLAGTEDLNYLMPEKAWDIVATDPVMNSGTNAKNGWTCWINGGKTKSRDWSCIVDKGFKEGTWNQNKPGWIKFKSTLHEGWKNVKLTTVLANEMASVKDFPIDPVEYDKMIQELTATSKKKLATDPRTSAFFKGGSFEKPNEEAIALQVISMRGESKHINQSLEEIGAMVKFQKKILGSGSKFPSPADLIEKKNGPTVLAKYGKWLEAVNTDIEKVTGEPMNMISSKSLALRLLAPVMQSKISVVLVAALSARRANDYDNFVTMKNVKTQFEETCVPEASAC
jgi:hypothetical protein